MARRKPFTGSAEINATVARVAPAVLKLLTDGAPRTKAAIVGAMAGQHGADDVGLTLVRLTVNERVVETGGRYTLAATPG